MIRKLLKIFAFIIIGLFFLYVLLGFVVIPFSLKWAIEHQGKKILKHPINVQSIQLNPFTLRLSINQFEIQNQAKQPMLAFQRLLVNVSFRDLLKKIYRVENVSLEGPYVNVVLLNDGSINLLKLVPEPSTTQPTSSKESAKNDQTPNEKKEIPLVTFDNVEIHKGKIIFKDETIIPNFQTMLSELNIKVTGLTTRKEDAMTLMMESLLDKEGKLSLESRMKPLASPIDLEMAFTLNNYAMQVLTPYVGKYTGLGVENGKLDLRLDYRIADNTLTARHKLKIQKFGFGEKVESEDALNLPFNLALAILEDSQGQINIALPAKGDLNSPEFKYSHLVGETLRNFLMKVITKPFALLTSVIGSESGSEELGYVRFSPGKVDLSDVEKEKLKTLMQSLKDRPKILLEIPGAYDSQVDWLAIKKDMFTKEYDQLIKESTKSEQWVLEFLYQRRFSFVGLWKFAAAYRLAHLDEWTSEEGQKKYLAELRTQLIEHAPADKIMLDELANKRAQVIYEFMIQENGFPQKRVRIVNNREVQSTMDQVPLEFSLSIFEEPE